MVISYANYSPSRRNSGGAFLCLNIHIMLILKDKETIYLTIVNDKIEASKVLPETGITFEFETLSNRDYTKSLMLASKVAKDGDDIKEETISSVIDFLLDRVKAVHNTKYKKHNFAFDTYFPILNYLLNESTLNEEEKDFLP